MNVQEREKGNRILRFGRAFRRGTGGRDIVASQLQFLCDHLGDEGLVIDNDNRALIRRSGPIGCRVASFFDRRRGGSRLP